MIALIFWFVSCVLGIDSRIRVGTRCFVTFVRFILSMSGSCVLLWGVGLRLLMSLRMMAVMTGTLMRRSVKMKFLLMGEMPLMGGHQLMRELLLMRRLMTGRAFGSLSSFETFPSIFFFLFCFFFSIFSPFPPSSPSFPPSSPSFPTSPSFSPFSLLLLVLKSRSASPSFSPPSSLYSSPNLVLLQLLNLHLFLLFNLLFLQPPLLLFSSKRFLSKLLFFISSLYNPFFSPKTNPFPFE
ncbi:hypothetical protein B0T19DRAFT_77069 [Cercophora scortea]|uniref:Uncharacterized protein n=1 Tax=Cercophora scortea TaxID=314031 RepID=A0AAE0MNE0_9PEZI|nr:hypothetical protein B0T19DRAFT_77069 [Cercophora scortea]